MRTLLMVDDERNIRLGLKAIIDREYPGEYSCLFAEDGEEALRLIRSSAVDIVITDIRMPGMDGLTLIREMLAGDQKPAVIILSGFDDFQYAKEAIQYEVKEYLLKPIVKEELFHALQRVERDLSKRAELSMRLEEADHYRDELLVSQLNYIFVHGDMGEGEIMQRCAKVGLDAAFENGYYIGLLKLHEGIGNENGKVSEFLAASRFSSYGVHVAFEDKDGRLVVIAQQEQLFGELLVFLKEQRMTGSIGLSGRMLQTKQMKQGYGQAREALKYGLLQGDAEWVVIRHDQLNNRLQECRIPVEDIRKLANMLGTDRDKEMRTLLHDLLDAKKIMNGDIAYLEEISRQLNELVFDQVFNRFGEESVEILRMYKKAGSIYNFETIHQYIHHVEDLLLRLNDYIKNLRSVYVEHREMKNAVRYIQENYYTDLNMASVSNHVSLNYSYFSQTFKEFTGESFVVYLKRVRIQKAKELLEQTDDKIYEIGARVGFESAKQFNRVFRELEGISAMEYRSKHAAHKIL
ncbi:response regulator [Paenibacillus solisilvae]|uniref:Response regulator n=1 Tax=Paenibacillus solisilvae TaxID=2486751 RepID=A0ABW0VZU4_9BACL